MIIGAGLGGGTIVGSSDGPASSTAGRIEPVLAGGGWVRDTPP
jgi:hypothetical protein